MTTQPPDPLDEEQKRRKGKNYLYEELRRCFIVYLDYDDPESEKLFDQTTFEAWTRLNTRMLSRKAVEAALNKAEQASGKDDTENYEPDYYLGYIVALDDIRTALGIETEQTE